MHGNLERSAAQGGRHRLCLPWQGVESTIAGLYSTRVQMMFAGSMVALVTPMTMDGSIDFKSLEDLIEFHVGEGTDALVVAGTTGELASLETGELKKLLSEAIRIARGRVPVIAGSGHAATSKALILTRLVGELGADAALVMAPPYVKPTQEGLEKHYLHIADGAEVPIILYNVPSRTACDMLPATVARLSAHPGIVGIKEATGDVDRVAQILASADDGFEVYSGDDITAAEAMLAGAIGVISVTANVAPALMHEMCDAALAGDASHAAGLNAKLAALHQALFLEANPIPVKWALADLGHIPPGIRLPLTPFSEHHHLALREALREARVI